MTVGSGAGRNAGEPGSRPDGERETTSRRSRQPILAMLALLGIILLVLAVAINGGL